MQSKTSFFNKRDGSVKEQTGRRDRLAADAATAGDAIPPPNASRSWLFNITLFRKNLTRFWPIWTAYLVFWTLLFPVRILTDGWEAYENLNGLLTFALVTAVFFGLVCAMAVFSYLHSAKSVSLMHALPIRREGLFLTNYLSGLSFLVLPNLLVFALSALLCGGHDLGLFAMFLLLQCLMCLFFYSFAVFCAMFTGNLLALPVFYGVLNFLAAGLLLILNALMDRFIFGFQSMGGLNGAVAWLTPAYQMGSHVNYYDPHSGVAQLLGVPTVAIYGLAGVVLAALALLVYRRRRLETAGDLVSVPWVRPIFKYGVAFCSAVALGTGLYALLADLLPSGNGPLLVVMLLCGAVGYFAAEMLLKKSFKVFSKSWKGVLVFSLVMTVAAAGMEFDLFGFNRAPASASVASVRLAGVNTYPDDSGNYAGLTLTTPDEIETVLALHNTIAANKAHIQQMRNEYDGQNARQTVALPDGRFLPTEISTYQWLELTYTMTDDDYLLRRYDLPLYADNLADPDSVESALNTLLNRPGQAEELYFDRRNIPEDALLINASLGAFISRAGENPTTLSVRDDQDQARLLAAVKADMAAGNLGRRYLFDDRERQTNCYLNDLTFTFYLPETETPSTESDRPSAKHESQDWTVTVTLQTTATETLAVLDDLNLLKDGAYQLVTHLDYNAK